MVRQLVRHGCYVRVYFIVDRPDFQCLLVDLVWRRTGISLALGLGEGGALRLRIREDRTDDSLGVFGA